MGGPPLEDELWHVGEYYESMRNKVRSLPPATGPCYELGSILPERICRTPLQGRTQHTPRLLPKERSLSALARPDSTGRKPENTRTLLDDRQHIDLPCMNVPEGVPDIWPIVSNRRRLATCKSSTAEIGVNRTAVASALDRRLEHIQPGRGWEVGGEHAGYCDGSYYGVCGREKESDCPLINHHDSRGFISGNELSGWLVMDIPNVKEGLIMIKLFTWLGEADNQVTSTWKTVNGSKRHLRARNATSADESDDALQRHLKLSDVPDSMKFEFSINGKVTTWTKAEFTKNKQDVARTVEVFTLLDDPSFPSGNIELGIQFQDCGRSCTMGLTHVYWA